MELTNKGSFEKDFALRNQINRASGSVMDNIAEGFERDGKREFIQFLSISKGSIGEVRSQLYRALDRGHLSKEEFNKAVELAFSISKMLNNLIVYLKHSDLTGNKFKEPNVTYNQYPELE